MTKILRIALVGMVAILATTPVVRTVVGQTTDTPPTIRPQEGPMCAWAPSTVSKAAGGQCGFNDAGAPNPGIFQCGMVSNGQACVEQCVFVRCQNP
jgi:hypothetical protein